jgi:hypothetical protein
MINGVEVTIGTMVRLVNDLDMYIVIGEYSAPVVKPVLYGYYVVRGFVSGHFPGTFSLLLDGIVNKSDLYLNSAMYTEWMEPGFRPDRFTVVPNPKMSQADISKEVKVKGVKIKIDKEVIESLELEEVSMN